IFWGAAGDCDGFDPSNPSNPTSAGRGAGPQHVILVTPRITITKECVTTCPPPLGNSPYGQPIQFRGTICNTGDNLLDTVTLSDNPAATTTFAATKSNGMPFDPATGLNPGECVNYTGSYQPVGNLCGPFTDVITVTATP